MQNVLPNPRRTSAALPRAELALHDGVDIVVLVHDGHTLPFDAAAIGFHTLTQALSSLTFFGATSFRATNLLVIGFVVLVVDVVS